MCKPLLLFLFVASFSAADAYFSSLSAQQIGQKLWTDVVTTTGLFGFKNYNVFFANSELKDIFGKYNGTLAVNSAVLLHFVSIMGVALLATQLPARWWSGFTDIIPKLRSRYSRERLHHVDFDYVDDPDYLYDGVSGSESRIKKRRRAHGRRGRRPAVAGRRSSFDDVEEREEGQPMGLLDTIAAHLLTKRSATLNRSAGPKEYVRKKPTGHNYRPRVGATNHLPVWLRKVLHFIRLPIEKAAAVDRRNGGYTNFLYKTVNAIGEMISNTMKNVGK